MVGKAYCSSVERHWPRVLVVLEVLDSVGRQELLRGLAEGQRSKFLGVPFGCCCLLLLDRIDALPHHRAQLDGHLACLCQGHIGDRTKAHLARPVVQLVPEGPRFVAWPNDGEIQAAAIRVLAGFDRLDFPGGQLVAHWISPGLCSTVCSTTSRRTAADARGKTRCING